MLYDYIGYAINNYYIIWEIYANKEVQLNILAGNQI